MKSAEACGYPGQTFRGDCFVGRVFDDTQAPSENVWLLGKSSEVEDEWRRMDFTLKAGSQRDVGDRGK